MNWKERLVISMYAGLVKVFIKKLEDEDMKRELNHGLVIMDNELRDQARKEKKT